MADYGKNLVGNIKVKTRSSGGSFVDMGKTKSDIEKNVQEMEKLVNEIKSDPKYSTDSGKMINDLKEDIRKLRLIQYDSRGKPTEESLTGIYGKDVKNAKEINMTKSQYMDFLMCLSLLQALEKAVKDKNSHTYITKRAKIRDEYKRKLPMIDPKILGEPYDTYRELMSLKPFIRITKTETGNSSAYSALYNFSDNEIDKLHNEANKLERLSYSEKDDAKAKKLLDESIKLKDKVNSLHAIKLAKFAIGMLEKAKDADELDEIHDDINNFLRSNPTSNLRKEFAKVHDKFKNLKQKFKVGNAKFKDKDGTLFEISQYPNGAWFYEIFDGNGHRIGDVGPFRYEDDAIVALKRHNSTVRKIGNKRVRFDERDDLTSRKSPSYEGFRTIEGVVLREGKTFDGGLVYTVRDDRSGIYSVDAKKAKVIGNKNVVTLKSIPKRIDLDKKSDLEKAIKDITDLSKDYEHGIKVNDDDKYMHDKFVALLKEANDEVKELKKVLSNLH